MSVFATRAMLAFALVFLGACGTGEKPHPCRWLAIDWESGSCEGWECQVSVGIDAHEENCESTWEEANSKYWKGSRSFFLIDHGGGSKDSDVWANFNNREVEVPYLNGEKNQVAVFPFRHNAGGDGSIVLYFSGRIETVDGEDLETPQSWWHAFDCTPPDDGACALAFELLDTTTRNPRIALH